VLAAYNGQFVDTKTKPTGKIRIPNAAELTAFYPTYQKHFLTSPESWGLALRPPTLTWAANGWGRLESPVDDWLVNKDGNMVVVNAARMRRFSHTGDNYINTEPLRTPNPGHEGASGGPDQFKLNFTIDWFKCNVLVGDIMYAAGFAWPMSEFKRYLQPDGLMFLMAKDNPWTEVIWVSPHFAGNGKPKADVPYKAPTSTDLKNMRPGDVVLLHNGDDGVGHSAIVTSHVKVDAEGKVMVRVLDIYGEHWYDVESHSFKAILRPKKKLFKVPDETVGGDVTKPEKVLDKRNTTLPTPEKLKDDPSLRNNVITDDDSAEPVWPATIEDLT
jgi:hypothetical protein